MIKGAGFVSCAFSNEKRKGAVMCFSIADDIGINAYSNPDYMFGGNNAKSQKSSFLDVLFGHLPNAKNTTFSDLAKARSEETRLIFNQLLERMRAESAAKQMELLSKLMQRDDDKKPYDLFSKCLEIARKIMRGEKVSAEEMQLLAQNFPELLFQALLLRQEEREDETTDE